MKKSIYFGLIFIGSMFFQTANAQNNCKRMHRFCVSSFAKDQSKGTWNFDNQSKTTTIERGQVYEMSFVAYSNFIYRVATCTDEMNPDYKIKFEVLKNELVKKEVNGKMRLLKAKTTVFTNASEGVDAENYYKFRVNKTQKIYVKVTIPAVKKSAEANSNESKYACLGVLLQHRRTKKVGF